MRKSLLLTACGLLSALACAGGKNSKEPAPAPAPAAEPASAPASPAPAPAAPVAVHPVAGGLHAGAAPLIPPAPGGAQTLLAGCLADAEAGEGSASRFPAGTRAAPLTPVTVTVLGTGAIITHTLEHACCLKADVASTVEGGQVKVVETLSGQACRCLCASTIKTAVGLTPGEYALTLSLVRDGNTTVVHQGPVVVKRLGQ